MHQRRASNAIYGQRPILRYIANNMVGALKLYHSATQSISATGLKHLRSLPHPWFLWLWHLHWSIPCQLHCLLLWHLSKRQCSGALSWFRSSVPIIHRRMSWSPFVSPHQRPVSSAHALCSHDPLTCIPLNTPLISSAASRPSAIVLIRLCWMYDD